MLIGEVCDYVWGWGNCDITGSGKNSPEEAINMGQIMEIWVDKLGVRDAISESRRDETKKIVDKEGDLV